MNARPLVVTLPAVLVVALVLTWLSVMGQTPAALRAQRTPTGQPNFQGIWQTMSSAHYDLEPHAASLGVPAGVGVVVDPPDGKIPYKPEALTKRSENSKNRAAADPFNKCYKPGTPHMIYLPFPLQIIQTPMQVTILSEYMHNTRNLFLTRKSHYPPDSVDLWNGDSVARFDGDVLLTDVANFNGQAWLDRAGNFASDQLHVTERFQLIDNDTIRYEATLEDPKTYTRPWTIRLLLYRHKEPNVRIMEYECHAYSEDSLKEPALPTVR
jgi:hypothetical protein